MVDRGIESNFQQPLGEFQRGRALVAADFDLDGRVDFFVGNPNDRSFILRNVGQAGEQAKFEVSQILTDGDLSWGAVAADFDNDGDYDLFITKGGNEGPGYDQMFRNLWLESGKLTFEDVTSKAGVAGPVPKGFKAPIIVSSANAVAGDYDRDGDIDLFVSVAIHKRLALPELKGRNILWRNDGNWHFTDAVGLSSGAADTRHSTFLDIDNDGDLDIVTMPLVGPIKFFINGVAGRSNHALELELRDEAGNPYAIGATVTIRYGADGTLAQMREVQLSGGFASFDEPLVHFGLGDNETVQSLTIRWPDGDETTVSSEFSANTRYRISRLGKP